MIWHISLSEIEHTVTATVIAREDVQPITSSDILKEIHKLVLFPAATVCRHYVAVNLLNLLECKGYGGDIHSLAQALVEADDETAVEEIGGLLCGAKSGDIQSSQSLLS